MSQASVVAPSQGVASGPAMPCPASGTLSHMTVVFRPLDKECGLLLFGARGFGGIREMPVQPPRGAAEHRTGLVGLVADRDHGVERLARVAVERLALLPGDVDAQLSHRRDRQGSHACGPGMRRVVGSSWGIIIVCNTRGFAVRRTRCLRDRPGRPNSAL